MRAVIIVILAAWVLSACAIGSGLETVKDSAADAADFTLKAARVGYCDAPTLGAMRRDLKGSIAGLLDHVKHCPGWQDDRKPPVL